MTRLLMVDDHLIVRAGLKLLLSDYKEITVVGEAGSGVEAVQMVREADWDVILLDISMPGMNGIEALAQIKRIKPGLPVLILTMHPKINMRLMYYAPGPADICVKSAHRTPLSAPSGQWYPAAAT